MSPNSYQLAFFSCCREIYDKSYHFGVKRDGIYKTKVSMDEEDELLDIVNQIEAKQILVRGNAAIGDILNR